MSGSFKKIIIVFFGILILKVALTKKTIIPNNKTYNIGELIISIPETEMDSYPVVYVFGGINYATPEWMFSQVPKELLYNTICVFCLYKKSVINAVSEASDFFSKN